jgi:HK97 family phage major capsid protein/HK97 family phage prohead protease
MQRKRAFSLLTVKSIDEEQRIIEGIASTPTPDRMGDIVEPEGAAYDLPLPLLWQHRSDQPIGQVLSAKVTAAGISIRAQIAKEVLPYIDQAWALIKAGLVRGLSIGFIDLETSYMKETGGFRILRWEWLELSAVTIPANADASIQTVKSIDDADVARAASGQSRASSSHFPGDSGRQQNPLTIPKAKTTMKTYKEQIQDAENKRAANVARMEEIHKAASGEGRDLNEQENEEYEGLEQGVVDIDRALVRLRNLEKLTAGKATPVTPEAGQSAAAASASRSGKNVDPIFVRNNSNLPKGIGFTRLAMLKAATKGDIQMAAELAKRFKESTPEVEGILRAEAQGFDVKTAVTSGTTTDATWAGPLVNYQILASEFVELLRPATIIGRIQGLRRVPFNVRIPVQSTGASAGWVGQNAPKPMSSAAFTSITFDFAKIAVIVAITEELARFSNPSAEALVQQDMINAIAQYSDQQFIDPAVAAVANVSPASVTNGVVAVQSAGSSITNVLTDISSVVAAFVAANISLTTPVWIMHPNTALALSMKRTAQDLPAFPDITLQGGSLQGIPVLTSASVPYSVSAGGIVVLMNASDVLLADDGQVTLDMSREASLQFNTVPSAGAQSLVSLWQNNLIGIRAERYLNWAKRRAAAVQYVDNVHYT